MKLPLLLAGRYLTGKKSHNAINIISWVSLCGVAVITMALICTLSVYNGFQDLIAGLYSEFDPELKIEPARGKTFAVTPELLDKVERVQGVDVVSQVLSDQVLLNYADRQLPATLMGVDTLFARTSGIEHLIRSGAYTLGDSIFAYTTIGVGLAAQLGVNAGFVRPIDVYAPRRTARVNLSNPIDAFGGGQLFVGGVFCVSQSAYDDFVLLAPIAFARDIFEGEGQASALHVSLAADASLKSVQRQLREALGPDFMVLNRMEQQQDSFRIMQIEKWMTFLMLSFILMIASFNVVGSLSMLIVDKQADIATLRNLGADVSLVRRVFILEGCLISGGGAAVGIALGALLCWAQETFGLISLGSGNGMFIVDAYPVSLQLTDCIGVVLVVALLGLLAAIYPAYTMIRPRQYAGK
jgi:ABC-type lipoprotein release transport system permease subunit